MTPGDPFDEHTRMWADEIIGNPDACEACNGTGWVQWDEPNRSGGFDNKCAECRYCDADPAREIQRARVTNLTDFGARP